MAICTTPKVASTKMLFLNLEFRNSICLRYGGTGGPSNVTLAQLYHRNEHEKRTKYGEKVRVRKSIFCPFTTLGGMALP